MARGFLKMADLIQRAAMSLCVVCLVVVLFSMSANVLLRHGAGLGFLKLQDLTGFAFAVFAVLAIPCALAAGRHVRVDFSGKEKTGGRFVGIVNLALLGGISMLLLVYGWPIFTAAWAIGESSGQIGGLGGLYWVKAFLPITALLLLVQGLAQFIRDSETAD